MANSAQVRQALDIFFQKKGPEYVRNTFFPVLPFFDLIFGLNGTNTDAIGLGRPGSTVLISGMGYAKSKRLSITAQRQYMPLIVARGPATNDGDEKSMTDYDHTPTMSASEDKAPLKAFDQPRARFIRRKRVLKVWHSELRTTKSDTGGAEGESKSALRNVYEFEHQRKLAVMCQGWSQMLMGTHPDFTSGAPTDEDQNTWDALHSIRTMMKADNTYLGVDRSLSQNAYWRGHYTTSARNASLEDLLNEAHYDFGIMDTGGGIDIVVTGKKLFQKFKKEADNKGYRMISLDKIPDKLQFGSAHEVVEFGFGSKIVHVLCDPGCPQTLDGNGNLSAGDVYLLNSRTFTLIIHPDNNFALSPWEAQDKMEGNSEADVAYLAAEVMFLNEVPSWNAVYTNVS